MNGSDINSKDNEGKTALHEAAIMSTKDVAECLILHGVNINAADNEGYTALYYALKNGKMEIAELPKSHGAIESVQNTSSNKEEPENDVLYSYMGLGVLSLGSYALYKSMSSLFQFVK